MTASKKLTLKYVMAIAMSLFSLVALFVGTAAWFMSVRQQLTSGEGFSIDSGSQITVLSCYSLRYDGKNGAQASKVSKDTTNSIAMSEYDYILKDRNVNTSIYFRLAIANYDTSKDLQISISCSGEYKNDQEQVNNFLSNVIMARFACGLYDDDANNSSHNKPDTYGYNLDNANTSTIETIYSGMRDNVKNNSIQSYKFVNNQQKPQNSLSITLSKNDIYKQNYIHTTTIDNETTNYVIIYVEIDYCDESNNDLIDQYIQSYQGADHLYTFNSDIDSIALSDI